MSRTISGSYANVVLTDAADNPVTIASDGTIGGTVAIRGQTPTQWTIANYGTVAGATSTSSSGIVLLSGGTITNASGASVTGAIGAALYGTPSRVENHGVILASVGTAVRMSAGGTVHNTGTIAAPTDGYAVSLGGGHANRVIIAPEAVFVGTVDGGNALGSPTISTLELASSSSSGTLADSQFINFAEIAVNAGAQWRIAVAIGDDITLSNSGTISDTLLMQPGGQLSNAASGLVTSADNNAVYAGSNVGPVTITNFGTINQGTTLSAIQSLGGATIANSGNIIGGSRGIDIQGATGTVINTGIIGAGYASSAGVILRTGGLVSNASAGTIAGQGFGVYLTGGGSIVNQGRIAGPASTGIALSGGGSVSNAASGIVTGLYQAIQANDVAATIVNNGSVVNTAGGGIVLNAGGGVTNQGSGIVSAADSAIVVNTANGAVTNLGRIASTNSNGVGLFAGGSVSNATGGTISGYYGVQIAGAAGSVTNAGTISGVHDALRMAAGFAHQVTLAPGGVFTGKVDGGNTIGSATISALHLASAATSGTLSGLGSQFVNFAQVSIASGAAWTLTGSNTIGGELLGGGSVTVVSGSTLEVDGTVGGVVIAFDEAGGRIDFDAPTSVSATVTSFEIGDVIDLKGVNPNSVTYAGGTLSFAGGSFGLSLAVGGEVQATASSDGAEISVLCFCANTLIRTPRGEVAVQDLATGDAVLTERGTARRIVWIGTGKVLAARGRRTAATPVIVRRGALADNVPHRDLRLTKGHALHLDGVLIPVEFLVNHRSIEWDDMAQEVELFHIELENHDVLLANGAPAESYRDDGNLWLFRNADTRADRLPRAPYAPVLTGGPLVDAVWRRLLQRAGPRPGLPVTVDPDLHLLLDGHRVDAASRHGDAYVFALPRAPGELRIMSRAAAPDQLGVARDPRVLGVALRRIALRQATRFCVVEAGDQRLADGFHMYEPDAALRWTTGDALVPPALFAALQGPFDLILHIGCTGTYLIEPGRRAA